MIRYGLEVWGNSVHVKRVLILQKKALRYIEKAKPLEHCRPLFIKHGILTVVSLYIYLVCIFIYKNRSSFKNNINKRPQRLCRYNFDILVPELTFMNFKNSLEYNGIKMYNFLNEDIRQCSNINEFSIKLKSYLIARPFYNLHEYFDRLYE